MKLNEKFDFVYSSLQKDVFDILHSEFRKVEEFLKGLDNYDDEILNANEDINQFYRYLEKLYQIITDKAGSF